MNRNKNTDEHQVETPELSEEQKKAKREQLVRGQAFDEMVRGQGFKLQKAFYQNSLQDFVNRLFSQEEKKIEEFENERQRLIGLKNMFGTIDWEIKQLKDEQKA